MNVEQHRNPGPQVCAPPPQPAPRWYALHTQPQHERAAEKRLRDSGMETFLPTRMEVHRWSDRRKRVEVPLFSCYVFVRCLLNGDDRRLVQRTSSVHGFVSLGGIILPVPDDEISELQRVLAGGSSWQEHPYLAAGQRVRVRGGAMDGIEGIFLSRKGDRSLVVSIEVMQRSVAVNICGYDVEAV